MPQLSQSVPDKVVKAGAEANDKPPTSIFLSYSRDDRNKASALVGALEVRGLTVWWDGLIEGGHEFAEKIEQALKSADVIVVLWSLTSVHSHWVRDEAATGRDRGRMVPVTIDGAEPPLGFRQIQHVDLTKWRGRKDAREIDELCRAIEAAGSSAPLQVRSRPSVPSGLSRRSLIAAGVGAVALVGGGAAGIELFRRRTNGGTSIGVMAFRNLSGDPAEQYFSDGVADELRATLSQNGGLQVAAETSSGLAEKKSSDPRAIASALGVDFLIEGSARRASDTIRIAVQIVDGSTGFDKWSQTFDRKVEDMTAVQSEIAAFVTDALLSRLSASKAPRDRLGGTHNNEAFEAYLRGYALYNLAAGETSDAAALSLFQKAVTLDPNYAVAHAALSRAYTVFASSYELHGQTKAYYKKAEAAARAAIRAVPGLADGYSALGFVLLNGELDLVAGGAAYQRSFQLGYGNADILLGYANFASRTGRFAEGREALSRTQRLDPLNPDLFRTLGLLELDARRYAAAATALHTALMLSPQGAAIHRALGDVQYMQGNYNGARQQYELESHPSDRLRGLAIADMKLSRAQVAESEFAELRSKYGDTTAYQQAQVFAQWGRVDEALTCLERAVASSDAGVVRSKNDPLLDPIKKTVRFATVERNLGYV